MADAPRRGVNSGATATTASRGELAFIFVGTLDFRGRLLKEIRTLQNAGFECRLFLGNIGEREVNASGYDFEIKGYRVPCFRGKIRYFFEQLRFAWRAGREIATTDADAILCLALDGALAGVVAKWLRPSLKFIFDSNELHLESFNNHLKRTVWKPLQALVVKSCDAIVHAETNRMEHFKQIHGGGEKPQVVIENFPHYQTGSTRVASDSLPLKVIYLGALGNDRYTHELIEAGRSMSDLIDLDFVGFATPEVMADLERRYGQTPAPNIRILPPVMYDEIPSLLKKYQIGIALYKNTNLNNYYCAPNKVYDYLMNGMSVIANDYPGLRTVLEDGRLGACVEDVTPDSMREAVNRILRENRWENITDDVRKTYSWEQQEKKLVVLFDD